MTSKELSRNEIAEKNFGLIWCVVKRFQNRGYEMEDLFQIGCIGLLKAIDRFDAAYGVQFSTYAVPLISGEIKRFLRDDGLIKVSRMYKEQFFKINHATEELTKTLGRAPTMEELENRTGYTKEEIVVAMDSCSEVESIYKTIYQGDGEGILLIDQLKEEHNATEFIENRLAVKELLDQLQEKERRLIILRYFQEKTQGETANLLGMTQVQVSRMEKKILNKLKRFC